MKREIIMIKKVAKLYDVRIRFTDVTTGRRREKNKKGFTTSKDARQWERKTLVEAENGLFNSVTINDNATLDEAYAMWLNTHTRKVQDTSITLYNRFMRNHVLTQQAFKGYQVKKITPAMLQLFVNDLSTRLNTYKKRLMPFKQTMQQCQTLGIINENPFDKIIYPAPKPAPIFNDRLDYYTKGQLQQFISSAKALYGCDTNRYRIYALFRLLAFSGMRRGEALALDWSDIDYNNHTISISKNLALSAGATNKIHPPKTKAGKRDVVVDNNTLAILRHWQAIQARLLLLNGKQSMGIVFTNNDLNDYQMASRLRPWLIKIANHAGLPRIKVHGFRHTYATLAIQAGMNVKQLQYQLGHDDVQTTLSIYTTLTQSDKVRTADIFTSLVNF